MKTPSRALRLGELRSGFLRLQIGAVCAIRTVTLIRAIANQGDGCCECDFRSACGSATSASREIDSLKRVLQACDAAIEAPQSRVEAELRAGLLFPVEDGVE
jgi:hypothetical protein